MRAGGERVGGGVGGGGGRSGREYGVKGVGGLAYVWLGG